MEVRRSPRMLVVARRTRRRPPGRNQLELRVTEDGRAEFTLARTRGGFLSSFLPRS